MTFSTSGQCMFRPRACLPNVGGLVGDDQAVTRAGVISDEFWVVAEPVLPTAEGKRGRRWRDHREVLEAIAWRFRTGSPWRDLPDDLGVAWQTAWKRHRRWAFDGTYAEIFAPPRPDPGPSHARL